MDFFLGTHMPSWFTKVDIPLFVSHRRLSDRKRFDRARGPWALDSGGFTELSMFGEWRTPRAEYVEAVRRYMDAIGSMLWAAPQDWMCEPFMLERTGLTVAEHQARTVENFLQLADEAPDVPFVPVLQGWALDDYFRCIDRYAANGVDLLSFDTVGLGSVCRRQSDAEIAQVISHLSVTGIRLHGFGVKGSGIRQYGWMLRSADSMAWSYRGRRIKPCPHGTAESCANCLPHALAWRDRALSNMGGSVQLSLDTVPRVQR